MEIITFEYKGVTDAYGFVRPSSAAVLFPSSTGYHILLKKLTIMHEDKKMVYAIDRDGEEWFGNFNHSYPRPFHSEDGTSKAFITTKYEGVMQFMPGIINSGALPSDSRFWFAIKTEDYLEMLKKEMSSTDEGIRKMASEELKRYEHHRLIDYLLSF